MAGDSDIAFAVGSASTIVCYGLAYLIFKKLISDKYGKGKEKQSGIYFWCGLIGLVAIGQGLGTVVNEVIFSLLAGVSARGAIVERGIFTLFAFPAFVAFIAFVIVKVTGDKSQINQPSFVRFEDDKPSAKPPVSTSAVLLIIAVAVLLAYFFIPTSIFNIGNGKTLLISGCEVCRNNECKSTQSGLKKIKIEDEKKIIFFIEKDGELSIQQRPTADENCTIVKSENYAFECINKSNKEFLVNGVSFSQSFTTSYNGKEKYSWTAKFHSVNGEKVFDKLSCIAK